VRSDPVELLASEFRTLRPSLVPIRVERMVASPFAFFRGAGAVMAEDVAPLPTTGIEVQVCGDAHLANFGMFATPERALVFDINDFDETVVGSWEWDVKRFATSVALAGRAANHPGRSTGTAIRDSVQTYVDETHRRAQMSVLDSWYDQLDSSELSSSADDADRAFVEEEIERARSRTSVDLFAKLTVTSDLGVPKIVERPPLIVEVDAALHERAVAIEQSYRASLPEERRVLLDQFRLVDVALKVVGVGSVGTDCFVALFFDESNAPLFLQIKEARRPVWTRGRGDSDQSVHQGQRVVTGQRVMHAAADVFLGWTSDSGRDFYVRQLADMKRSPRLDRMSPQRLGRYASLCARALARGHARSGQVAEVAGYIGSSPMFANAMVDFALAYAEQTERDHRRFVEAVNDGRFST
jgi:uncharacterized protein (DUF2252 family)